MMKNYSGPGNEARVRASGAVRVKVHAIEQLHVESNSERGQYVLHSKSLPLVLARTCQATLIHDEDMYS